VLSVVTNRQHKKGQFDLIMPCIKIAIHLSSQKRESMTQPVQVGNNLHHGNASVIPLKAVSF
jgi:hypothetical protein